MNRKCTRRIGQSLVPPFNVIYCEQPARYIVTTVDPDTGWHRIDWHCPGCVGKALTRAETATTLQTHQAPDAGTPAGE